MQGTFQEERPASIVTKKRIWSPMVNKGDECVDMKDREEERGRSKSTSNLLIAYMEEVDNSWTSKRRAALDLWSGWLACLRDLD